MLLADGQILLQLYWAEDSSEEYPTTRGLSHCLKEVDIEEDVFILLTSEARFSKFIAPSSALLDGVGVR